MSTDRIDRAYDAYVAAITEQIEQHISALDELSAIADDRPLSFNERSAVERSIQVVVEAAIGCSKHVLRKLDKPVPSEGRASIERVYELLSLVAPHVNVMRGAIGMRNSIVHDNLNPDWQKISQVLKTRNYRLVQLYTIAVSEELLK